MSVSFYLQFLALRNGTVEPCHIQEMHPDISSEQITKIVTMELAKYGIQHNPYILDFLTVLNQFTIKKRFVLENLCAAADATILTSICYLLGLKAMLSVGIGVACAGLFTIIFPKYRRRVVENLYLFCKFIICHQDRTPKSNSHVLFSASGKVAVRLNEYLLKYSSKEQLVFVDELSINDFIYNLTEYIKRNVSFIEKVQLCFIQGHRLHKHFISEKDFMNQFEA